MQDFRKLTIWKKSHLLTLDVYRVFESFPNTETYGLTSQMRRASASIPTNVAEGCCRKTDNEFSHFLTISLGSASELEYQILLAYDLKFITQDTYKSLDLKVNEIKKMLITLINKIKK